MIVGPLAGKSNLPEPVPEGIPYAIVPWLPVIVLLLLALLGTVWALWRTRPRRLQPRGFEVKLKQPQESDPSDDTHR